MSFTRRKFLYTGLGATLGLLAGTGCGSSPTPVGARPRMDWPELPTARPSVSARYPARPTPAPATPTPAPAAPAAATPSVLRAIPRRAWAKGEPIPSRMNAMAGVRSITVHHEGGEPIWFTDTRTTASRLEIIRGSHLDRMRAGDMGYHFVIDRAGRLWEGRSLQYQGAHVRHHNEHNLGIMVLGNFDRQQPSDAQMAALQQTLKTILGHYRLRERSLFTHQELVATACPGKSLQPKVEVIRHRGLA